MAGGLWLLAFAALKLGRRVAADVLAWAINVGRSDCFGWLRMASDSSRLFPTPPDSLHVGSLAYLPPCTPSPVISPDLP